MKKFITFTLLVTMLLGTLSLFSCRKETPKDSPDDTSVASEGLTYQLDAQGNGYIVTGMGTCTDTRLVIPSTYNGLPVISIAKGAFQAKTPPVEEQPDSTKPDKNKKEKKEGLVLPARTLSIPTFLADLHLLADTLPDIEEESASSTPTEETPEANITEIVIPDSVMDIGDEAFYGCEALATFDVSNLINLIGTDAFKDTAYYLDEANWTGDALYLEEYLVEVRPTVSGEWTVREGTVNIASNAFEGCTGITAVSFPSSLRFVGNMAFFGCTGISEIDLAIPGIQVGNNAFEGCTALTTVKIATNDTPNAPPVKSNLGIRNDQVDEVFMPGGGTEFAFDPTADPELIYSATIGNCAFEDCTALTSVTLGSNIGHVGYGAFAGCTALTFMDLSMITANTPDVVVVTPGYNHRFHMSLMQVFSNCTSLKEVKLPQGIQWLSGTFEGCTALTEFTVPETVKGLKRTFIGCSSLKSITVPESVLALSETFTSCTSLSEITLPETLVKIGRDTFSGCDALRSVYVPDSVAEIGEQAFTNLHETASISLGKGIRRIDQNAICHVYAIIYRGTAAEWESIDRDGWGGLDPNEEPLDIICSDGTITNGSTLTPSMTGILLSDGTVYASYLGITVMIQANGQNTAISLSLSEVEAELTAKGAVDWRHVTAEDLLRLSTPQNFPLYAHIAQTARWHIPQS